MVCPIYIDPRRGSDTSPTMQQVELAMQGDGRREGGGAARLALFQTIREGTMRGGSDLPVLIEQLLYIWAQKNWCFWTVLLEKTLESPLDCKEIQPVHPKGNQSWIFIGRTNADAEAPILWPPDAKNWLIRKDSDAEEDWRQEEKGMTEDEMVGWHHRLDGNDFTQAPGVGDGQGSLGCCSPWGHKESDTTEQLNWLTEKSKPRLPLPKCLLVYFLLYSRSLLLIHFKYGNVYMIFPKSLTIRSPQQPKCLFRIKVVTFCLKHESLTTLAASANVH